MELELLDIPYECNYTFVYYFVKLITCHEYTEFVVYQTKKMSNYKDPLCLKRICHMKPGRKS